MTAQPPPSAAFSAGDAALYAATVLIFGSGWLPLRLQLGVVTPEVSGFWRFLIASLIMFALAASARERLVFPWRDHVVFAGLGLTLFSLNFIAFYHAGYHLPSGLMSVVFSLAAVFIPLLSWAFLRVGLKPRILGGALLGVAGTVLVFGPAVAETGLGAGVGLGVLFSLAGTLFFSLGSIGSGLAGRRGLPLLSMSAWSMAYGTVVFLVLSLLMGARFEVEWSARYLGSLAYLITVPTVAGFIVYLKLIRRIGASRAGYGTVLFPLVALAISTVFEGYHWTWPAALGVGLVLAGNLVVLGRPS